MVIGYVSNRAETFLTAINIMPYTVKRFLISATDEEPFYRIWHDSHRSEEHFCPMWQLSNDHEEPFYPMWHTLKYYEEPCYRIWQDLRNLSTVFGKIIKKCWFSSGFQ